MKIKKYFVLIFLIVGAVVVWGIWYFSIHKPETPAANQAPLPPISQATYLCKDNKTIEALFYQGKIQPVKPGEPPIPTGSATIFLSDGRNFDLPQTISASGARYANSDESFVFWNKGNGALVLENDEEKDYVGCIVLSPDPGGLPNTYLNNEIGFSLRYPEGYSINPSYQYQGFGSEKTIKGVKFTIPESLTKGTNLSSDSRVSIETISANEDCNANLFFYNNVQSQNITDHGREYSFAFSEEGAVGHRYEEQVWAFPGTNSCFAVRYFIHSTVIENYPEGKVIEFDKTSLINTFDKIRSSLNTL